MTCPPINASIAAYPLCQLGAVPVYTINATKASDVSTGIKFAKENNIRLVIKNTGHDIVQRYENLVRVDLEGASCANVLFPDRKDMEV